MAPISSAGEKNSQKPVEVSKNLQAALPAELGKMPMLLSMEEIASPRGAKQTQSPGWWQHRDWPGPRAH